MYLYYLRIIIIFSYIQAYMYACNIFWHVIIYSDASQLDFITQSVLLLLNLLSKGYFIKKKMNINIYSYIQHTSSSVYYVFFSFTEMEYSLKILKILCFVCYFGLEYFYFEKFHRFFATSVFILVVY